MRVIRESDVERFLAKVGPYLRELPAENNLILGLLADLERSGAIPGRESEHTNEAPVLLVVEGARGNIEAVALQTPPRSLVVSRASAEAVDAMVAFAASSNIALPGVVGPVETAEGVATLYCARTGRTAVLRMAEMVYELESVRAPATAGKMRAAKDADEKLLAGWSQDFTDETATDPIADCLAFVRAKMLARQLFVWENGAPVSMAAWGGRTVQGVRIGYVYTPPSERKNGYASALVAALSQQLLDEGSPRCFLFTNAANATSNKIYRAIGYEHACDFRFYDFFAT